MKAKTIQGRSVTEIQSAVLQILSDEFKPSLAIVFMSVKQDSDAICELLHNEGIHTFGSTTAGEFVSKEISDGGIVIMLIDINPKAYKLMYFETRYSSVFECCKEIGVEGKRSFSEPAFIIVSGWLQTDGEEIVKGIEDGAGSECPVYGGMAGDDLALREPIVFTYGKKSTTGILALIIDQDKINVEGIATCGWKPIGTTKTVTRSEGNIVFTIDDKPALDLVIKYLGLDIDADSDTDVVTNIGAYYPLQLERENAVPVMRTAMLGNKSDRSLICAGNVLQGSKIRFSLPPDFDVIDTVVAECVELKKEKQGDADVVIMFSCISRYLSFGVMTGEEIERVQQVWDAPLIGFFTYGEFGKASKGKYEFHNNTCCVLVMKEK